MQLFKTQLSVAEAKIGELTTQLQAANSAKEAAEAKLASYEAGGVTVLDLQGKLDTAVSDLSAANGKLDAFKGAIGAEGCFTFGADEATPIVALTEAGKAKFVNAEAGRVLAASGHAPLPLAVDSPAPGNQGANGQSGKGRTKSTWGR